MTKDAWKVCMAVSALDVCNFAVTDLNARRRNQLLHALFGNSSSAQETDLLQVNDPWAPVTRKGKKPAQRTIQGPPKQTTTKWEDLEIPHMDELEPSLPQLPISSLQPDVTGVVLATLPSVDRHKWVRSQQALALMVPGQNREDLQAVMLTGGLQASAVAEGEITLRDPLKAKRERRRVTLINLGASPVKFAPLPTDLKVPVSDTLELWFAIQKRYASPALWQYVTQGGRKSMINLVSALKAGKDPMAALDGQLSEIYGLTRNQQSCECAARALTAEANRLLEHSGTHGVFVRKMKRFGQKIEDAVILWIPTNDLPDLQARCQPLKGLQGIVCNRQGLGVRVTGTGDELAQARAVLQPGKVAPNSAQIRGDQHFEVSGLPLQTEAADVQSLLDKLPTSTGVVLIEKLASPSEIFQQKEDQKRKEKVERFKYSPDKIDKSPMAPAFPASSRPASSQASKPQESIAADLKQYVDTKLKVIKSDLDNQSQKVASLYDDFQHLRDDVHQSLSKVATKDDIAALLAEHLSDKRQRT
ncbi:unnamed protein product [Cladocopium goreaui]|uniref:PDZ domain-containing protein n=1 Tax=Cladocopium goreaui TaxID=2562237 RepID=A0A9P1CNS9_9DINO|nr:unnamed protein product [Cladocopium goreaui]